MTWTSLYRSSIRSPTRSCASSAMRPLSLARSVRPLLFAAVLAVIELVRHHEVVRDLARLLVLDDALEQPLTFNLGRLDLHVPDLGREHEQLADEILRPRELDDARVLVLGQQRPVKVVVVEQHDLGGAGANDAVRVTAQPLPEPLERERRSHRREPLAG